MIPFDPSDPFPLLAASAADYAEAQAHSEKTDAWLGLKTHSTENEITRSQPLEKRTPDQQLWIELPVKTLLTPYTEIRDLLERLAPPPGSTMVDLGAGYGRMAFVIARHFPDVRFIGYEYVRPRVLEAQRCLKLFCPSAFSSGKISVEEADLSTASFRPAPAEFYFLYDFGSRSAIDKCLHDLRGIARSRAITVVGRGRSSRDAIERAHPWLSQIHAPEHFAHSSIYRS